MPPPHDATQPPPDHPDHPDTDPHADTTPPNDQHAAVLLGSLPCCVCGYELQGLSITGACPECGTAVRATILYRVDPEAHAFKPAIAPRLTALACRTWTLAALAAALLLWAARASELLSPTGNPAVAWGPLTHAAIAAIALSALASLALVHPFRGAPAHKSVAALVGTLVGYPLVIVGLAAVLDADTNRIPAYISERDPDTHRLTGRLFFNAGMILAILAHRPMARELVARCRVLRTKRVDRQTLAAIAAAAAIAALGDAIRLASLHAPATLADTTNLIGSAVVVIASLLITIGLAGATIDSWRIARSLLTPSPTHAALLGAHKPTADSHPEHHSTEPKQ